MKRIISAIAVVAIVTSALAFAPKKGGQYCAANTSGGTCNIISGVTELGTTGGFTRFKFAAWNGVANTCTGSPNCTTQTTFYNE